MFSKNINNKKCAHKLILFNEKKIEKDSDNFWYRKLTLKVERFSDFALFDTSPLTQFSKFNDFLLVCWFLWKNLSNFVPPVWKLHNLYCHNIDVMCWKGRSSVKNDFTQLWLYRRLFWHRRIGAYTKHKSKRACASSPVQPKGRSKFES